MKNAPPSPKKKQSALVSAKCKSLSLFTPRQCRVLVALIAADRWIPREEIDRIAGASNGPQVIAELRHRWGIDIAMERADRVDRDNRPCKPGQYRLKPEGRARLKQLGGLDV